MAQHQPTNGIWLVAAHCPLWFVIISSFPTEKIVDKKYALGLMRLDSSPEAVILASLPMCHLLQESRCSQLDMCVGSSLCPGCRASTLKG